MEMLAKIDHQWFVVDVFLFAFLAWLLGCLIYQKAKPHLAGDRQAYEAVSDEGFTIVEWVGSFIVVCFYSAAVWLPLFSPQNAASQEGQMPEMIMAALTVVGLMVQFVFPCLIMMLLLNLRVNVLDAFGLRKVNWGMVAVVGMGCFFASIIMLMMLSAGNWYESAVFIVFGETPKQAAVEALSGASNPLMQIVLICAAVIFAPICEEILFRGFLYTATKKYTGPIFAIIVSSLLFSIIHGSASSFFPLFIIGLLLTIAYEFTGSLWTSILVHAAFNLFSVAMMQLAK